MTETFFTVAQIKSAAKAAGSHFFTPSAMRFFNSTVLSGTYPIDNGAYFVTGENDGGNRAYTVRLVTVTGENGFNISTVGEFMEYATPAAAKRAAKHFARYGYENV